MLLAKWWWSYGEEKVALQRKIIANKYGDDNGIGFLSQSRDIMSCIASVESGRDILFWYDDWVRVGPLFSIHPRVFRVVSNKEPSFDKC